MTSNLHEALISRCDRSCEIFLHQGETIAGLFVQLYFHFRLCKMHV